jgi:carboxyl-terminal processing protease
MHHRLSVRRVVVGTVVGVTLLGGAFALGARYGAERVRERDAWADGRLLSTAIDSVRANALDSLPDDELIRRAVAGMLRELHDPYAALMRTEGYESYRGSLLGESQGMGMSLRLQGTLLSVRRVTAGSPAAAAGVQPGDRVLAWDGKPVRDVRTPFAKDSTRAPGAQTELLLFRAPLGDTVRLRVRRTTWHAPAVTESGLLADSVGYVRLASITQHAADELEASVERLRRRGATSLVLDLRGNGGGLFEEGVKAASLFLPNDAVVASLTGRGRSPAQVYRAKGSRWPTMPMTLLVDAGTASAAEVIAAALREHQRALVVGVPTYGKGVVQRVVRLSPELSLRLTTARWLTPAGRSLERRAGTGAAATGGLRPDVLLDDAGWRDPSGVPREWSVPMTTSAIAAADSAALLGLREGWVEAPPAVLESQLRTELASGVPRALRTEAASARWLSVATRLATVRLLEIRRRDEALLRYTMREDAAMRAGFDVLAPGLDVAPVMPSARMKTAATR